MNPSSAFGTLTLVQSRRLAASLLVAVLSPAYRAPGLAQPVAPAPPRAAVAALPASLTDSAFWKLVTDVSEPGGYFRLSDNFTSNEIEVGTLSTMLREHGITGGAYLGVGPEQNFSYIAAVQPKMAFVVDIRRQAVMQHLMFKAMFELAKDRADFLTLLFAKPRPSGLDTAAAIAKIWDAYRLVPTDSALGRTIVARVEERLTRTHRFTFTAEESAQLRAVLDAFQTIGPEISTRGSSRNGGQGFNRSFVDMTGYANDSAGRPQSFLSSEDNYRYVKSLQERNLIVPVSGDFAGPKAIRTIGAWLKDHDGTVSAFYVSNVEQYLFQDAKAQAFYDNVATLPVTDTSVFIRPYSMRRFGWGGYNATSAGPLAIRSLCPIEAFLRAVAAGRIHTNDDALACQP